MKYLQCLCRFIKVWYWRIYYLNLIKTIIPGGNYMRNFKEVFGGINDHDNKQRMFKEFYKEPVIIVKENKYFNMHDINT